MLENTNLASIFLTLHPLLASSFPTLRSGQVQLVPNEKSINIFSCMHKDFRPILTSRFLSLQSRLVQRVSTQRIVAIIIFQLPFLLTPNEHC